MPALSPTMSEGNLTKWMVKVGDQVKAGDILAEIETDKATMEVEAVDEGKITKLLIEEGSSAVPVNSVIAILDGIDEIEKTDENIKDKDKEEDKKESFEKKNITIDKNQNDKNDKSISYIEEKFLNESKKENFKASPFVKKIAKNKNIDLMTIKGSGPEGRIIKRDIQDLSLEKIDLKQGEVPSSIRKIIATRTTVTKQTVPHFYITIESNVDKLLEMRLKINANSKVKISINDILVKALALAQKMNPATNVSWIDGKIVKYDTIDVSIAVALNDGLITPIVRQADLKGLNQISNEIKDLVEKAKKGKLLPDEYNGGTISISNLGMFGISEFSAIINPPQSSILAVGAIKKMPYVDENQIKIVNVLKSTLSADHRVLDGAVAGKLLKDFHDIIQDPFNLWLNSNDMEVI